MRNRPSGWRYCATGQVGGICIRITYSFSYRESIESWSSKEVEK